MIRYSDKKIFIEPYTFGTIASKNFILQFEPVESSEQYKYLENHFEKLQESALNFKEYKEEHPDLDWLKEFNKYLENLSTKNNKSYQNLL